MKLLLRLVASFVSTVAVARITSVRAHAVASSIRSASTSRRAAIWAWIVIVAISAIGTTRHGKALHRAHSWALDCSQLLIDFLLLLTQLLDFLKTNINNNHESSWWNEIFFQLQTFRWLKWYSRRIFALPMLSMVPTNTNGTCPSSRGWIGSGSLSPSIFTRTTPDLSTISWITRPFLPITFPTRLRGTWTDSSPYSSILRAFLTTSMFWKRKLRENALRKINRWMLIIPRRISWMCRCAPPVRCLRCRRVYERIEC